MWHFILTTRQAVRISDHFDKANLWDQPYAQRLSPLQTMGKVCHSIHSAKLGITIEIAHIHPLYMTMVQLPSDYVDEMPLKGKLQAIPSDERATRLVAPHVYVPLHTHPEGLKTSMTIQTSPHYIFMARSSWFILKTTEGTWGSITQLISWMAVTPRAPLHLYKSYSANKWMEIVLRKEPENMSKKFSVWSVNFVSLKCNVHFFFSFFVRLKKKKKNIQCVVFIFPASLYLSSQR